MAACPECHQEMTAGVACTVPTYEIKGAVYERVPNGDYSCHDCRAPSFTLHHPGCDDERCPRCGGQSIGCNCDYEDCPQCYEPVAPGGVCEWC